MSLKEQCMGLRNAASILEMMDTHSKNDALDKVYQSLLEHRGTILKENQRDVEEAQRSQMKDSLVDRLRLTQGRFQDMLDGIRTVMDLKDPIWQSNRVWTLENGLTISRMTIPLGVIGIIYESRPNVTVDAFALALKSGNGILLRGSSSAIHSNRALVVAIREGLRRSAIPEGVVELVEDTDYDVVKEMLTMNEYIDLIIPRGGKGLIDFVVENATVPTVETGVGNCHIFVDESADQEKALSIIENAKLQRPGVCNAVESVLVHQGSPGNSYPSLIGYLEIGWSCGDVPRPKGSFRSMLPPRRIGRRSTWTIFLPSRWLRISMMPWIISRGMEPSTRKPLLPKTIVMLNFSKGG